MYIPQKRDTGSGSKNHIFIIIFVTIIFFLALCVCGFFLARYLRQRHYNPKYIPGKALKRKWQQWCPGGKASYGQVPSQTAANNDQDTSYRGGGANPPEMTTTNNAEVRRETSIRSVITLPAYSANPNPTEQVVAREGERAGMDMVVEFPETAEEEEARREEQMEALYQVRLNRRQEQAERDARREERRAARARGDSLRLAQIAAESRVRNSNRRSGNNSSSSLSASAVIAENQARERARRIASVSYADLGHVRHDGSRLRADSANSDHRPLLQNAAGNPSSPSLADQQDGGSSRIQSMASSIRTVDTGGVDLDTLTLVPTVTQGSSRPASQFEEADLGDVNIPPPRNMSILIGVMPQPTRVRTRLRQMQITL
ncbi:hypothetical protein N7468_006544 [Penicillium chermesinum]|uniref:Uncharacterized protein n=1 Tax=Penicillium chermesinum TaxID=63820 RepID=A0A9W9TJY4_9EURO|nr:uncharacterized protein N7468_006544 [Penicillium chermesinum]KAJ5225319.1 hypothetical protein N7468_006544 [Penicillium chermesinum]